MEALITILLPLFIQYVAPEAVKLVAALLHSLTQALVETDQERFLDVSKRIVTGIIEGHPEWSQQEQIDTAVAAIQWEGLRMLMPQAVVATVTTALKASP